MDHSEPKRGRVTMFFNSVRRKATSRFLVELVSLVSAAAFLVSSLTNAFIFWWNWGLNYFAIATPTDVIMSSFYAFWKILVVLMWLSLAALMVAILGILSPRLTKVSRSFGDALARRPILTLRLMLAIVSILLVAAPLIVALFPQPINPPFRLTNPESPRNQPTETWQDLLAKPIAAYRKTHPVAMLSGLVLDTDDPFFKRCGAAKVVWLGSGAALIDCRSTLLVIRKVDGLVMARLQP